MTSQQHSSVSQEQLCSDHCVAMDSFAQTIVLPGTALLRPLCCHGQLCSDHCVARDSFAQTIVLPGTALLRPLCCQGQLCSDHCVAMDSFAQTIVLPETALLRQLCCQRQFCSDNCVARDSFAHTIVLHLFAPWSLERVGDSSPPSEEIVKISNCAFQCNHQFFLFCLFVCVFNY